MTLSTASPPQTGRIDLHPSEYVPGVCNIGPAEIARRRRTGHVGATVAVVLLAVLLVTDAPAWTRLLVLLPAAVSASGYLQARLRFCAGFGAAGVFNFAERGTTYRVADPEARRRDRAMALRIGAASFAIGLLVAIVAVLLPV
jgi:hypothetical protein